MCSHQPACSSEILATVVQLSFHLSGYEKASSQKAAGTSEILTCIRYRVRNNNQFCPWVHGKLWHNLVRLDELRPGAASPAEITPRAPRAFLCEINVWRAQPQNVLVTTQKFSTIQGLLAPLPRYSPGTYYELISPNTTQRCSQCLVSSFTLSAVCSLGIHLVLTHSPHCIII